MTNTTLLAILAIVFIHWVADFVMQTDWQAQNKSKSWKALLSHTFTYSFLWLMIASFVSYKTNSFIPYLFVLITFVVHTITDYFTSRVNSRLFGKDWHNFFVSVGFDQALHYTQLFVTYYFLWQC